MAHLPYDVAYKIFERLADREPEDRRFMFPFDHPAMLGGPIRDDAPVHLRTCALVCRSWSLPASTLNIRYFRIWHASADAVTAAISGHGRHLLVQKMEVGREWCPECHHMPGTVPDGSGCRNGVDIPSLLAVIRRCANVRRLALYEHNTVNPIDEAMILASPQFNSVRSLKIGGYYGCAWQANRRLTPRIFCAMLRLFPSLTRLAVGRIFTETSQAVDAIPPPTFQLQSLVVTTLASGFLGYDWLLHNSSNSIQTVWICGLLNQAAIQSFLNALELGVTSLRCFHMHPLFRDVPFSRIGGILQRCTQLVELAVTTGPGRQQGGLDTLLSGGLPFMRSLILPQTTRGQRSDLSIGLDLVSAPELLALTALMKQSGKRLFPRLSSVTIDMNEQIPFVQPDDAHLQALRDLRDACLANEVDFRFPRMQELEDEAVRVASLNVTL